MMVLMTEEEYLTSSEAMAFLRIGKTKLFKLIKNGDIIPSRIGEKKPGAKKGPSLRFKKSDLEKLLK